MSFPGIPKYIRHPLVPVCTLNVMITTGRSQMVMKRAISVLATQEIHFLMKCTPLAGAGVTARLFQQLMDAAWVRRLCRIRILRGLIEDLIRGFKEYVLQSYETP